MRSQKRQTYIKAENGMARPDGSAILRLVENVTENIVCISYLSAKVRDSVS